MRLPTIEQVHVFDDGAAFRRWLEAHNADTSELWVGYYRKGVPKASITYPEAVEQALCFGWIDGIGYRINDEVYANRFTPRRRGSNWSAVNVAKVAALEKAGLMHPAGRRAFEARDPRRDAEHSYETRPRDLPPEWAARVRANAAAWRYWQAQTPSYRRAASWWVLSAKQGATRERRLTSLIEDSSAERPIKPLAPRRGDRT